MLRGVLFNLNLTKSVPSANQLACFDLEMRSQHTFYVCVSNFLILNYSGQSLWPRRPPINRSQAVRAFF